MQERKMQAAYANAMAAHPQLDMVPGQVREGKGRDLVCDQLLCEP